MHCSERPPTCLGQISSAWKQGVSLSKPGLLALLSFLVFTNFTDHSHPSAKKAHIHLSKKNTLLAIFDIHLSA